MTFPKFSVTKSYSKLNGKFSITRTQRKMVFIEESFNELDFAMSAFQIGFKLRFQCLKIRNGFGIRRSNNMLELGTLRQIIVNCVRAVRWKSLVTSECRPWLAGCATLHYDGQMRLMAVVKRQCSNTRIDTQSTPAQQPASLIIAHHEFPERSGQLLLSNHKIPFDAFAWAVIRWQRFSFGGWKMVKHSCCNWTIHTDSWPRVTRWHSHSSPQVRAHVMTTMHRPAQRVLKY